MPNNNNHNNNTTSRRIYDDINTNNMETKDPARDLGTSSLQRVAPQQAIQQRLSLWSTYGIHAFNNKFFWYPIAAIEGSSAKTSFI